MIKRFRMIPSPFVNTSSIETFDYEINTDYDDVSIVDTSGYVPNKQAVQILQRQFAMDMLNKLSYDLPQEIADGAVNLFARRRNIDIAELSQHQAHLKAIIEKNVSEAKRRVARMRKQPSESKAQPVSKDSPEKD